MAKLKHFKVTALPGTLSSDAIYFVANGTYAETYVTDSTGVAKMVGNSTMINNLIAQQLVNLNTTEIVANITERDTLTNTLNRNTIVYVIDATGDPTVLSGAASYLFNNSDNVWYKIAEYESLDIIIQWNNIQGRPSSTPVQIDTAVTNSHTHSNKAELDKIGEDVDGDITYNGNPVLKWTQTNW